MVILFVVCLFGGGGDLPDNCWWGSLGGLSTWFKVEWEKFLGTRAPAELDLNTLVMQVQRAVKVPVKLSQNVKT